MRTAEIVAIGDELTSGQRLDTNSQWISQQLADLGIRVLLHTTVADDLKTGIQVLRQAIQRVDLIICTGGLGPTADDLTRETIARATDRPLQQDDEALAHIENLFRTRNRKMPQRNTIQAMFPEGSLVVPNPHGSAPGIDLTIHPDNSDPARVFALPGVPAEMVEMWNATVQPRILVQIGDQRTLTVHHQVKCFGVGESDLEQMLPDLIARGRQPTVGITVSQATITLRISATGSTEAACRTLMQGTIDTIHNCLGDLVFAEGELELQHVVHDLLNETGLTLATIECGNSGLLTNWLSESHLDPSRYQQGLVIGGPSRFEPLWKDPNLGSLTSQPAEQLVQTVAQHALGQLATDIVLVLGPEPTDQAWTHSDDRIHYALAIGDQVSSKSSPYSGHPAILRARSAKQALNHLRLTLLALSSEAAN